MSTYPVLNDRPIDQWTVTELKDELERKNLPVSGLKDDLLKRLFEAMQDEILDGEGKAAVLTSPPEEPKGSETLDSIDASVKQASVEQYVDKGVSEVAKQGADLVISVTEAYDECTFATSEVTQEAVVSTAEASQKSLDAVVEVESSLVDTAATDETNVNGLDSASNGNAIVKEANPHSEGHDDTIEKTPEDDTNKKMAVDCVPSDLTGSDIKLDLDVHSKILTLEDEPAPLDMKLHSDHEDSDAVAVAELEDDTSKKMIIDDVPSGLTHTNVELGAKVDCKIEQEEVSTLFDATALHAYPKERIVAAAKGLVIGTAEASRTSLDVAEVETSLVDTAATDETNGNGLDSTASGNTIVKEANPHSEGQVDTTEKTPEDDTNTKMAVDHEPYDLTGGDIKLGLDVHSKILKLEDELTPPDMKLHSDHEDSDAVEVAEPEDDTSKKMIIDDVPSGSTHTNVVLGAKVDCEIEQEEVSTLFDATALHAYPKERIVAATKGLVIGTAEASQRSLDVVAEVESSLVDTAATDETNGIGLDSTASGNTIVKEANPHSEGHVDTIEKTLEDDTNKKMAVDDEPSDLTGGDIKLGLDVHSKILKLEDELEPPDMKLHSDHEDSDAVEVAEPEDDTSKKMIIDDVPSGPTHTNVELGAKVDCEIEQEEVSTLFDATALHAYPKERIVAAAKGLVVSTAEASQRSLDVAEVEPSLFDTAATDETNGYGLDSTSNGDTIVKEANPHSEGHVDTIEKTLEDDTNKKMAVDYEPSDLTGGDIKLGLNAHSKILKLEDDSAPPDDMLHSDHEDSDAVAVAEPEYGTSKKIIIDDVPSDPTHTNVELGAKVDCKIEQEEVSILSDATALHACHKEHIVAEAKGLALPTTLMSGYTSNIDLVRKDESPDRNSREKLNLDRSSGDESMDEDVMESKHEDSYIKPDDLRGKSEVASEHVFKEVSLLDTRAEGSSAHSKEVVTEEKPPTPTEKRKPEDQEVIENNEPIKRQRLWNKDAVNISDQQASKINSTGAQKEVICPARERSFGRPMIARRNSIKERIVPPAKTSATTSLRIDRFVRPFTLKAVQELLGKTGSVCSFWMDQIKTHCYVTYSSVEEAVATRNAVYNLQWPPNNHNYLIAEFVDPEDVKLKLETPPPSQVPISQSTVTAPQAATFQQPEANQTLVPPNAPATSRVFLPTPAPFAKLPPTSDPGSARESLPPPPPMKLEPARTLDELFKKTQAYPRIFYMPLSEEEVSAKRAARDNGKRG